MPELQERVPVIAVLSPDRELFGGRRAHQVERPGGEALLCLVHFGVMALFGPVDQHAVDLQAAWAWFAKQRAIEQELDGLVVGPCDGFGRFDAEAERIGRQGGHLHEGDAREVRQHVGAQFDDDAWVQRLIDRLVAQSGDQAILQVEACLLDRFG